MFGGTRRFVSNAYGGLPAVTWLICLAAFVNRAGSMVLPFLGIYLGRRFGLTVQQSGPNLDQRREFRSPIAVGFLMKTIGDIPAVEKYLGSFIRTKRQVHVFGQRAE